MDNFYVLLTNEHYLTYNQNDRFAFFLRQKLKLLSKCCVLKARWYIYSHNYDEKMIMSLFPAKGTSRHPCSLTRVLGCSHVCFNTECTFKIWKKPCELLPNSPEFQNRFVQLIRVGNSIMHKWLKKNEY